MSQLTQWPLPIQEDLGLNPGIGNFFATYSQFAGSGFESYFRYTERSINIATKISFPLRQSNLTKSKYFSGFKAANYRSLSLHLNQFDLVNLRYSEFPDWTRPQKFKIGVWIEDVEEEGRKKRWWWPPSDNASKEYKNCNLSLSLCCA